MFVLCQGYISAMRRERYGTVNQIFRRHAYGRLTYCPVTQILILDKEEWVNEES